MKRLRMYMAASKQPVMSAIPSNAYAPEALMAPTALNNSIVIEQFFEKAKERILADLATDVRVRPIRVSIRYDVASYHALACANWPNLGTGIVKPVEQLPIWRIFQSWLAERQLQASWVFSCDKAGVQSWWELTTAPINNE